MTDTIPHPTPPLEDARSVVARRALAELPDASDNEEPYFWLGRLSAALADFVAVAAPGGRAAVRDITDSHLRTVVR
jgi:hypothetical protein